MSGHCPHPQERDDRTLDPLDGIRLFVPGPAVAGHKDSVHLRGVTGWRVIAASTISCVFAACENPQPPMSCGAILQQTVTVGQTGTVIACFNDPNGDLLSYVASSSNPGVAAVSAAGNSVTITALSPGNTSVTVTATDPDGLKGQQVFQVTVPNRAPLAQGTIPSHSIIVGQNAVVNLSSYFTEPDGQTLSYSATAEDLAVATPTVNASVLTVTAVAKGTTSVTATATDPGGLTGTQVFQVVVPNRAPVTTGAPSDQTLNRGEMVTVDVSVHFDDPDGDPLTYEAVSSDPATTAVTVHGQVVSIAGVARGEATVTVLANDPGGLHAQSSFLVTVTGADSRGFQIDLVFATPMSSTHEGAFRDAAERWMSILADTELPDVSPMNGTVDCSGEYEQSVETIDDLMIVAAVVEIDGPGKVLGQAGPCWARGEPVLPYFGRVEFDLADMEELERDGTLRSVILHEMAHVLGIGTLWRHLKLLHNPSLAVGREVDTYLPLPLAVAAFDRAGGANYTDGGKVPVENKGDSPGSDDGHWRKSVFGTELMTPSISPYDESNPLSEITLQALADLGYTVDVSLAGPYRLPTAAVLATELEESIDLGNDIIIGPITVTDRNGRIVRVIPPS